MFGLELPPPFNGPMARLVILSVVLGILAGLVVPRVADGLGVFNTPALPGPKKRQGTGTGMGALEKDRKVVIIAPPRGR